MMLEKLALRKTAYYHHLNFVVFLYQEGAKTDAVEFSGYTPIILAFASDSLDSV